MHDGKKARGSCDIAHHVLHVMETIAGYSILPQGKINQKLCEEQRKYLKEFLWNLNSQNLSPVQHLLDVQDEVVQTIMNPSDKITRVF